MTLCWWQGGRLRGCLVSRGEWLRLQSLAVGEHALNRNIPQLLCR